MNPHDALTEIATLLERERSSRYKSKAFRAAADAIAGLTDEQLRDAASLRRRKGIGDSTFAVIQEALAGERARRTSPTCASARASRRRRSCGELLRGDLHSHSDWSDGLTSIDLMVDAARALGHEYLALTDHSPRLRVANGLSPERLRDAARASSRRMSGDGFTLLSGIEVDILDDGALDQEPDLLDELDIVVASAHSKLRMERGPDDPAPRRGGVRSRTSMCSATSPGGSSRDRAARARSPRSTRAPCSRRARRTGVAVEINSRPERQDPPDDLLALALELGCLFSIDSDAHAPGQLSLIDHGAAARGAARGARRSAS